MPKYLYRIEHAETKIGLYNCRVKHEGQKWFMYHLMDEVWGFNFCGEYHTPPHEDGFSHLTHNEDCRYGFKSLALLKKWFGTNPKHYAFWKKHGLVLRRYTVAGERFDSQKQSIAMKNILKNPVTIPFTKILTKPKKKNKVTP